MKVFQLLSVLALILVSSIGYSAEITSITDGDWEDDSTWDLGRVPTNGDVIIIDTDDEVEITTNNTSCNGAPSTHIFIHGIMSFSNGAKLNLGCGSSITVEAGGLIDGSGGGSSKKIYICGILEWDSGDPDVVGPFTFGTALPVELTDFSSIMNDDYVTLTWTTQSEENNDYFELLRSTNGFSYELIGTIEGSGTTSSANVYEYDDMNPIQGTSYYKLKQTDFDGENEEFGPIVVEVQEEASGQCIFTIYPNPCPGNCRAKFSDCPKGTAEMRLMMSDATGHVVNEVYPIRDFDGSFDIQIDVDNNLKPGIYIITALTGEEKFSEKAIIN